VYLTRLLQSQAYSVGLILALLTPSAFSENSQSQSSAPKYDPKKPIVVRRPPDPVPNKQLIQMIELPDLPSYSGKTTFIRGHQLDGNKETSYQLTFYAKETPDEVKNFYNNVFSMYNWTMIDHSAATMTAAAKNGGQATVSITKADRAHKDQGSIVVILYRRPNS
jgi:hypothetical protein